MTWMSTTLVLTAIFLVSLQGISFFSRVKKTKYTVLAGILNLFLATGGLIAFFLFRAGALIASPEYGVLMVQGTAARGWACLLLIGAAIASGIIWQIARQVKKLPSHPVRVPLLGLAIGLAATYIFRNLNPFDPTPFCIRFYDMWWPPLLVWLVVCLSQWVATTIGVLSRLGRILWATFFVTGIGFLPVSRTQGGFRYGDPSSEILWKVIVCVGVPLFMVLSPLVLMRSKIEDHQRSRRLQIVIVGLAGCVGLVSAWFWTFRPGSQLSRILPPWMLWAVWIVVFAGWVLIQLRKGSFRLPLLSPKGRRGDAMAGIALLFIGLSLADLTHFILLDPAWDLAALIFFWILLLEMIACAKIVDFRRTVRKKAETVIERLWKADGGMRKFSSSAGNLCKKVVTVTTWVALIVRLIVAIAVLIAAAEIPYAGKTIVHSFNITGLPNQDNSEKESPDKNNNDRDKEKNKYLEHELADRVANTLALIGQELRPDVLVAVSPKGDSRTDDRGDKRRVAWVSATSEESDGLETAAKSSSLSIPGMTGSLSLEFLTAPIQGPMRNLLGIRTIHGSIQAKGNKYVLLASSSNGQTWRASSELEPSGNARASGCSNSDQQPETLSEELQLADMLAYQIVSSDPMLIQRGGTSSWRALKPFHDGMVAWNNFELTTDYNALNRSIIKFREAVCEDPAFALAQYRLGRALNADGQPGAAVAAYRESLHSYPDFVAGHIALASTLSDFDHYYYYPPPAVSSSSDSNHELATGVASNTETGPGNTLKETDTTSSQCQKRGHQNEAKRLWRRVIQELDGEASVSDRAAAYAGLCQSIMSQQEDESQSSTEDPCQDRPSSRSARAKYADSVFPSYAAFFYCKRAEYLYSKLPSLLSADGQIKAARASALNQIGKILDGTLVLAGNNFPPPPVNQEQKHIDWSCDDARPPHQLGPYTQYALKYYQKALAILPEDWEARCYFAVDSWLAGNSHAMHDLDADAYMHIKRGDRLWGKASDQNSPEKYKEAIDEYKKAIDLDPANIEAMNDYANAFWDWRLRLLQNPPSASVAHQAEDFARRANAMTGTTGTTAHLIPAATLLEVLLGEGRPHEALEVLNEDQIPNHAYFDDVLWDLAEAHLCAEASDLKAKPPIHESPNAQEEAGKLFKMIRDHEEKRESRPFSHAPEMLSTVSPHPVCLWSPEKALEGLPDRSGTRYKLYEEKPAYSAKRPCNWLGVEARMVDSHGNRQDLQASGLVLQVWGAGVDRHVPMEKGLQVVLTFQPKNTHQYYFARLVDNQEKPRSPVYTIQTFANESNNSCSRNLITLRFLPEAEKPSPKSHYLLAKQTFRR